MRNPKSLILIATVAFAMTISCGHDANDDGDIDTVNHYLLPPTHCSAAELDSAQTAQALVGEWQWKYYRCGWKDPSDTEFASVKIKFAADGTVIGTTGAVTKSTTWHVKRNAPGTRIVFSITLDDPAATYYTVAGDIEVCEPYLAFTTLDIDGCENYFKRSD